MKIKQITEQPKFYQKGGKIDKAIGRDSRLAGLTSRAQTQTGRRGMRPPVTAKPVDEPKKAPAQPRQPVTKMPARIQDLPDGSGFLDKAGDFFVWAAKEALWTSAAGKTMKAAPGFKQFVKATTKRLGESVLAEGGAMPGVGPIHIDEIEPTLTALEKVLGIDLKGNVLGSVGKREFSGDIDVALQIDPESIPQFIEKLKNTPEVLDIEKTSVIMTKVQIVGYDEAKQTSKPRTGYVQVDFMPGDPGWLKTYYHSPSEKESKYKGVFRNIMIATIAAVHNRQDSADTIDDGRPVESKRWMWSPTDGLVRIKRTPVPNKAGTGYTKKNKNEIIGEPIKTADKIAQALDLDDGKDLNSYESLKTAIEKNYAKEEVQQILDGFVNNKQVQDIGIPDDLKQDESLSDKHLNRIKELLPR